VIVVGVPDDHGVHVHVPQAGKHGHACGGDDLGARRNFQSFNRTHGINPFAFNQPSFSSGNATLRNNQMRRTAKILEDHGVNIVFNGHEHNYQRTLPLRATSRVAEVPTTMAGPAVAVDAQFDGTDEIVPDGVLYIVEGAGGNRDFDGDEGAPRGSGHGVDQEDSATGTTTLAGFTFPNGPASWADIDLTNAEMTPFLPNAGAG